MKAACGFPRRARTLAWACGVALAASCGDPGPSDHSATEAPPPPDAWRSAVLRPSSVPGLALETAPGLDLQLGGVHVVTGSLGQRGPDVAFDPEALSIAALGGSFTFGLGLEGGLDWPTSLAGHIANSMLVDGLNVATLNLGVLDAQPEGLVGLFDARLAARPPWLLVVEINLDDLAGAAPAGRIERVRGMHQQDSAHMQKFEQALAGLRERCAPNSIGVLVVITPLDAGVPWEAYPLKDVHGELARAIVRNGLAPLDLLPSFSRKPREALRAETSPPHWNAEAQLIARDAVKRSLFEFGLFSLALESH